MTVVVGTRVPAALARQVALASELEGRTQSDAMREALEAYVAAVLRAHEEAA